MRHAVLENRTQLRKIDPNFDPQLPYWFEDTDFEIVPRNVAVPRQHCFASKLLLPEQRQVWTGVDQSDPQNSLAMVLCEGDNCPSLRSGPCDPEAAKKSLRSYNP